MIAGALTTVAATGNVQPSQAAARRDPAVAAARKLQAPYDSMRDYVAALDELGLLETFDDVQQDDYEATAIMYALIDEYGLRAAPAVGPATGGAGAAPPGAPDLWAAPVDLGAAPGRRFLFLKATFALTPRCTFALRFRSSKLTVLSF